MFLHFNVFSVRSNGVKLAEVELDCLSFHHQLQCSKAENKLEEKEAQKWDAGSPLKW